jgi:O-antigen ligase
MGSTSVFAMYLLCINFITVLLYFDAKKNALKAKMISKVMYCLSLLCIFMTATRMVMVLAVLLQCVVFILLDSKKKWFTIAFGVIATVLVSVLFVDSDSSDMLDAFYALVGVINPAVYSKISDGGQNVSYRLYLFTALGPYIEKKPIFGWGARFMSDFTFQMVTSVTSWEAYSIDNNFLSYLITYGVVGLMADVNLMISSLAYVIKRIRVKKYREYFVLIASIVVLYLLHLASVFQMGEKRIFFILVAVLWAFKRILAENQLMSEI